MKTITVYLHSDKHSMRLDGEEQGLSDKALENFAYALYEVELVLEVDEETGDSKIISVNSTPLIAPVEA